MEKYAIRYGYSERHNNSADSVDRKDFVCMEIELNNDSEFLKKIIRYAGRITNKLNKGGANTSEDRELDIVEADNLSGVIAEFVCKRIMDWRYGEGKVIKPKSDSSFNQIDLELYNGKTIEVRSSCVRNGIDFALFAKKNLEEQYFDVIGPYSNEYKQSETLKDYYVRVLYECDIKKFIELLNRPILKMYMTGGATKKMMKDANCYQIKHLIPAGGMVEKESDYRVIPFAKSLDVKEFFDVLEKENTELIVLNE